MLGLDIAFAVLMVAPPFPLAWTIVRFMTRRLEDTQRKTVLGDIRPAMVRLAAVNAAVVAAFVIWFVLDWAAISSGQRRSIMFPVVFGSFHGIWWPFVMPVLRGIETAMEKRGITDSKPHTGTVRVAGLTPRRIRDYLPSWSRFLTPALGLLGIVAVAIRLAQYPPTEPRVLMGAGLFAAFAVAFLVFYQLWIRWEVDTSYGVGQPGETASEYEKQAEGLRRFRIRGIFWFQILMAAIFFGCALLFVEVSRGALAEPTAGIIGGILGATVGCLGGVFGTIAGIRANRLNILRANMRRSEH